MRKRIEIMSMWGAGIHYKSKKYITHTTLPFSLSALRTFSWSQRFFIGAFFLSIIIGLIFDPLFTVQLLVGLISILYFIDAVFNLVLTLRSLNKPNEIYVPKKEVQNLNDATLPLYTILCPLYKETHIIPQFIEAIAAFDYPKNKLDVIILLEEDDRHSIASVKRMSLPYYFRIVIVPDSLPKTKPKACNYGLSFARGEYLVIYDAEDIPDPQQLKKAYLGFKKVPSHVVCLQAKLNYYNVRQNILTRIFTAEYSLWFDITLTGIQSFNSTIPLGGTSNHFKIQALRGLKGWDPFNVTEDADLGIRLFKNGFRTAIIDSTTYEEATSNIKNWIRQRSRWIKGYMQTYLVHMRNWETFVKEYGFFHYFIFQLTVGGKLLFLLLNPLLWFITLGYFWAYPLFGPTIEAIYQPPVFYLAVFSWIFGNFLFLYYYMLGCAKRNQWDLIKYVYFVPVYWGLMSYAALVALYQLLVKPFYWEKTMHGFHLLNKVSRVPQVARVPRVNGQPMASSAFKPAFVRILSVIASDEGTKESHWNLQSVARLLRRPLSWAPRNDNIFVSNLFKNQQLFSHVIDIQKFWRLKFPTFNLGIFSNKQTVVNLFYFVFLLSFDLVIAKIFLSLDEIKIFITLSLIGKIAVVVAQELAYQTNNFLSKGKKVIDKFYDRIFVVFLAQWIVFIVLGFEGQFTLPALFGYSYSLLAEYIGVFLFACMCFAIGVVFSSYHARRKEYLFMVVPIFMLSLLMPLLSFFEGGIKEMVTILGYLGAINLMTIIILHSKKGLAQSLENNIVSFFAILQRESVQKTKQESRLRILIFNWRDTKHIFSGGAEVYIHELAKRWVKDGNKVTLFCSNDSRSQDNERIDGIRIVRRGGKYTVYLFALMYYFLKFRGKYDVIVDCENGIPFFTPLFVRIPVVLLIHHVHQEVFRDFLPTPWRQIATYLEGKVMPYVYRNKSVITVSESSKEEIFKLGFTKEHMIEVIYNGVARTLVTSIPKTAHPSFVYLGRLKEYKNIDIAIKAFAIFVRKYPSALLSIVGSGEYGISLQRLVEKLQVSKNVIFCGRVTEEQKANLLSQSWAMLQPSQVEGWGITVIEANMAGTPVIASRVNGLKDSVVDGKTGILVGVRNIIEFASAMKKISEDPEYRNVLSRNSYLWSLQFDWDKSAIDFYTVIAKSLDSAIYRRILGKVSFAVSED